MGQKAPEAEQRENHTLGLPTNILTLNGEALSQKKPNINSLAEAMMTFMSPK